MSLSVLIALGAAFVAVYFVGKRHSEKRGEKRERLEWGQMIGLLHMTCTDSEFRVRVMRKSLRVNDHGWAPDFEERDERKRGAK